MKFVRNGEGMGLTANSREGITDMLSDLLGPPEMGISVGGGFRYLRDQIEALTNQVIKPTTNIAHNQIVQSAQK